MRRIDKYPELANYVDKLRTLTTKLVEDRSSVDVGLVNDLINSGKRVKVTEILAQATKAFSPNAAKDESERQENIHQAERVLNLCKILEESSLLGGSDDSRWKNIGIRAESNERPAD